MALGVAMVYAIIYIDVGHVWSSQEELMLLCSQLKKTLLLTCARLSNCAKTECQQLQ